MNNKIIMAAKLQQSMMFPYLCQLSCCGILAAWLHMLSQTGHASHLTTLAPQEACPSDEQQKWLPLIPHPGCHAAALSTFE